MKNTFQFQSKLIYFVFLFFCFSLLALSQNSLSMAVVESRREVSMADASGKTSEGIYRYYAKGEDEPYTGILFSKFENGNYDSWQEYVNGVGQGKWINYYENGNYREVGYYNQNRVEGPIKKYYDNGTLSAEGQYKDWRIKVGKWTYYNKNGKVTNTANYGEKGSIEDVQDFYDRGEISYSWYKSILKKNGF